MTRVKLKRPIAHTRGYRCAIGSRDYTLALIEAHPEKYPYVPPLPNQRFSLPPVAEQVSGSFDKLEELICTKVPVDEQEEYFYAIHFLMKWAGIFSHHETERQRRRNGTREAVINRKAVKYEQDKKSIIAAAVENHWENHPEDRGKWDPTAEAVLDDVVIQLAERYARGQMDKGSISKRRLSARIKKQFGEEQISQ